MAVRVSSMSQRSRSGRHAFEVSDGFSDRGCGAVVWRLRVEETEAAEFVALLVWKAGRMVQDEVQFILKLAHLFRLLGAVWDGSGAWEFGFLWLKIPVRWVLLSRHRIVSLVASLRGSFDDPTLCSRGLLCWLHFWFGNLVGLFRLIRSMHLGTCSPASAAQGTPRSWRRSAVQISSASRHSRSVGLACEEG